MTANRDDDQVSVLFGNPDGTFGSRIDLDVGVDPASLASEDFDNDGNVDLAVGNTRSNDVTVLFGDGSGGFPSAVLVGADVDPFSLCATDIDRDGNADVCVGDRLRNVVVVFLGDGAGSFGDELTFGVGADPVSLVQGDFRRDGFRDLATENLSADAISVLIQDTPHLVCRLGNVNASAGGMPEDVLLVNGSAGEDALRNRFVQVGETLEIELVAPSSGPTEAAFALYAWLTEPVHGSSAQIERKGLGLSCFPTPLTASKPQPVRIWNNLGRESFLGEPNFPSIPAPSIPLSVTAPFAVQFTLQGLIQDDGSAARKPVSLTNAVVVSLVAAP